VHPRLSCLAQRSMDWSMMVPVRISTWIPRVHQSYEFICHVLQLFNRPGKGLSVVIGLLSGMLLASQLLLMVGDGVSSQVLVT
jgi:hypothetical protein